MHETVHDAAFTEKRGRLLLSRGMPVKSESLRLGGVCDMVELLENSGGVTISGRPGKYLIYPVEYKRGRPDENGADIRRASGHKRPAAIVPCGRYAIRVFCAVVRPRNM